MENRETIPIIEVLEIPELREHILKYVIHRNDLDNGLSAPTIAHCRSVSKDWLQSTTDCVWQSKKPAVKIVFSGEHANWHMCHNHPTTCKKLQFYQPTENCEDETEKILFADFIKTHKEKINKFPPFAVEIFQDCRIPENYNFLSEFFSECGSEVVEMKITCDGSTMSEPFPNMPNRFVNLHKMGVSAWPGGDESGDDYTLAFIQSILDTCSVLSIFEFKQLSETSQFQFAGSLLPTTITTMELRYHLNETRWQVPTKGQLANVSALTLECGYRKSEEGRILDILESASGTLRSLKMLSWGVYTSLCEPKMPRLPIMTQLSYLTIDNRGGSLQFEPAMSSLPQSAPNLKSLVLQNVPIKELLENKFWNVEKLHVFHNKMLYEEIESMEIFLKAFPNVKNLVLSPVSHVDIVRCVFQALTKLTHLHITYKKDEEMGNSETWDALIIGQPEKPVENSEGLEDDADVATNLPPSIRNLTELHSLSLESWGNGSLISDAVFSDAFLEMGKLRVLKLTGRFKPSDDMIKLWRDEDREFRAW